MNTDNLDSQPPLSSTQLPNLAPHRLHPRPPHTYQYGIKPRFLDESSPLIMAQPNPSLPLPHGHNYVQNSQVNIRGPPINHPGQFYPRSYGPPQHIQRPQANPPQMGQWNDMPYPQTYGLIPPRFRDPRASLHAWIPPTHPQPIYSDYQPNDNIQDDSQQGSFDINERGRERVQNDYNQHFIDTGERPQNFVRDADESKRFEEYPKLERLMQLKTDLVKKRATPSQHIQTNLKTFDLTSLGSKFDVILVDPPWSEYFERVWGDFSPTEDLTPWSLEEMMALKLDLIAETPSFCFLWCGVTHLEEGRLLLNKWGFRRCEDICWLKTNTRFSQRRRKLEQDGLVGKTTNVIHDDRSYLQRTKEHCLMGIRGTVRRSQDTHFIHANLDTDVLLEEEFPDIGSTAKPAELYDVIERFCLGRRRLELFGTDRNIRDGWLTIGKDISLTNFDSQQYYSWFEGDLAWPEAQDFKGGKYAGTTTEIEMLRPKSPPRSSRADESAPE